MRRSTGEVKLRKTPNGYMFTLPNMLDLAVNHLEGKTFRATYHSNSEVEMIVFARKRTLKIRIGQ